MKTTKFTILMLALIAFSCAEFLEERPNAAILVPETAEDLRTLLNNSGQVFNMTPTLGEVSAGDYFTTDEALNSFNSPEERNSYQWADDIFEGRSSSDWNRPYSQIFYANVIIKQADLLKDNIPVEEYNSLVGSALFHRAFALFHLVQVFAPSYVQGNAESALGLPMRLTPEIEQPVIRPTLQDNYVSMISDLEKAKNLLSVTSVAKTFPTKFAAHALLSKIYLVLGDYGKSLEHGREVLQGNFELMDYNTINPVPLRPFNNFNSEMIFYAVMDVYAITLNANIFIDNDLISSYSENDLRKNLFFRSRPNNNFGFRGSYVGNVRMFSGLSLDEVLLINAESEARLGMFIEAKATMKTLLQKRYISGSELPGENLSDADLLPFILSERRKQLVFRGVRWSDLKRLNQEPQFSTVLTRVVNGQTLTLEPNSLKYSLPIPPDEINLSGIQQNPR
ncbi:SusD family protein [Aquiflexum balticum DSM 16537]|uniref:SusD family protein n=1 Tax=Aquiflexum balticum DSM 16537 TaxID=758820 RepID=A0A1W2H7A0_9BACT|nr:RagB/SusD family nutrient uptake outer membrane protein [Aquiflexum balticum]SMD44795.1 SusD family protein [Aquiflexum balticum DSM 16537]